MDWIPTTATAKGRLVLAALEGFGHRGYDGVAVADLARAAETTTGPLYHHFESKLGLYAFVRADVEQRVVDRMEGALAVRPHPADDPVGTALLVAFDYVTRAGFARMLSEPHPGGRSDPIAALLSDRLDAGTAPLGDMLAAAWRAALAAVAAGTPSEAARDALRALHAGGAAERPAPR
jgi:AcrR family transcriptional regulator